MIDEASDESDSWAALSVKEAGSQSKQALNEKVWLADIAADKERIWKIRQLGYDQGFSSSKADTADDNEKL